MAKSKTWKAVLVLMVGMLVIGCSGSKKPDTLVTVYDEAKMDAAIAQGKATLDEFMARFRSPQPGDADFALKVRIEDSHGVEYFWVQGLKLDQEPYSGTIENDPGIVKSVKYGQSYQFPRSAVCDWMYMSNGKMEGNFTLRVELDVMPPNEAAALKRAIGW